MAEVMKKFDRYILLDRIAQGGMAEIYRARMLNREAANRLIVIKRIQTAFGSNSEFVTMFKSEIRVTMGFNHPNVVQVYDFGEAEGQPYIAMELVDGRNLRQILNRYAEKSLSLPIDLTSFLIMEAASGLFYAHSYRDKISGESLGIIHRDISPQNILVSYEGNVKVIDFGIAKAKTNSESTRAGVIKGKPSYLSPEQISGERLDVRSDIFSLGAVFWELLTGRKLFQGDSDLAVLKQIEGCNTHVKPPSQMNPEVPKELDLIVLKMLAKDRALRFQNCDEVRRAIHKFVYSFNSEFSSADLSHTVKDLFKNEIVDDRKKIQKLAELAEKLIGLEVEQTVRAVIFNKPEAPATFDSTKMLKLDQATVVNDLPKAPESRQSLMITSEASGKSEVELGAESKQLLETRHTRSRKVPVYASPPRELSSGFSASRVVSGLVGVIVIGVGLTWYRPEFSEMYCNWGVSGKCTAIVAPVSSHREYRNKKLAKLRLSIPQGLSDATAMLNGQAFNVNNTVDVPLDETISLSVDRPGYKPYRGEFVISSATVGVGREYQHVVDLQAVAWGVLSIRTVPSAEATLISREASRSPGSVGQLWVKRTPLENEKVPAGTYTVHLVNSVLGMEKTVTIEIEEGKSISIDERLQPR